MQIPETAQQLIDQANQEAERNAQLQADADRKMEKLREELEAARIAKNKAAVAEEAAKRRALEAARQLNPSVITVESATTIATKLVDAMEIRGSEGARLIWDAIDDARCALLTNQVAPGAERIVLATEAVIAACDKFERDRGDDVTGLDGEGQPLIAAKELALPRESPLVEMMLNELKHILAGTTPEQKLDSIGSLIGQSVSFRQICQMHGLLHASGGPDTELLGRLIDNALTQTGFYENVGPWGHIKRAGAMSVEEAWVIRKHGLAQRKQLAESKLPIPGAPAVDKAYRPGRETYF